MEHSAERGWRKIGCVNVVGVQEEEEGLVSVRIQPTRGPRKDLGKPATPMVVAVESSIESEGGMQIATVDEASSP